jgi:hypothetical protein
MQAVPAVLDTYLRLAERSHQNGQAQQRDRFLVLAADTAQSGGRSEEAEALRTRLLRYNPNHLLKPYASFAQALKATDVRTYVEDLRRTYPPQVAAQMLAKDKGAVQSEAERPTKPIPPTQPVVDLDRDRHRPSPAAPSPVYGVVDEGGKRSAARPVRSVESARAQPVYAVPPPPPVPVRRDRDSEASPASQLSLALAVLTGLAGLGLAGYTLVWPFFK